jgi:DNA-directed RNA polymerase specialized sigma24 family protein
VLAQRLVDALRSARRFDPLPEPEVLPGPAGPSSSDPDRIRLLSLLQRALDAAIAQLEPRDRLRLACYYAQQLTLAETGRVLHEHEATVSRHLAKTRRAIRQMVERWLEQDAGLRPAEVSRCLQLAIEDPGPLDLDPILASTGERKIGDADRSKREAP